jgi:hypothetical protein
MSNLAFAEEHRKKNWSDEHNIPGGGLVYVTQKYDDAFSVGLLNEITVLYNSGTELEELAEKFNRHEMEILYALLHQADEGKITRPFAYRKRGGTLNDKHSDTCRQVN